MTIENNTNPIEKTELTLNKKLDKAILSFYEIEEIEKETQFRREKEIVNEVKKETDLLGIRLCLCTTESIKENNIKTRKTLLEKIQGFKDLMILKKEILEKEHKLNKEICVYMKVLQLENTSLYLREGKETRFNKEIKDNNNNLITKQDDK